MMRGNAAWEPIFLGSLLRFVPPAKGGRVRRSAANATTSSIAIVPRGSFILLAAAGITHAIHQVDERQEHSNNDAAHDNGQEHNHDGFEKRGHGCHGVIYLVIIVIGDL